MLAPAEEDSACSGQEEIEDDDDEIDINDMDHLCAARDGGVEATELAHLGVTAVALREAGYKARDLRPAGFTAEELEDAGYSETQIQLAGYVELTWNHGSMLYRAVQTNRPGLAPMRNRDPGAALDAGEPSSFKRRPSNTFEDANVPGSLTTFSEWQALLAEHREKHANAWRLRVGSGSSAGTREGRRRSVAAAEPEKPKDPSAV